MTRKPMLHAFAVAWITQAACSGSQNTRVNESTLEDPMQDLGGSVGELRRDLEATALELYSHRSLGNNDAFRDNLSTTPFVLFGVRPRDLTIGTAANATFVGRLIYGGSGVEHLSKELDVHVSEDGAFGWVTDALSYRVPYEGRMASLQVRYTAAFRREAGRWHLVCEHSSYPLPAETLLSLGRAEKLPRLRALTSPAPNAAASRKLRDIIRNVIEGPPAALHKYVTASESSLLLLPSRAQEFRGEALSSAPAIGAALGHAGTASLGDIRIGLSDTGTAAWAAAHITLNASMYNDPIKIPARATFVLEFRKPGGWEIVQANISVAVTTGIINQHMFSSGG